MRLALALMAAAALVGCVNWQEGYNNLARKQCWDEPGDSDRRACLDRAEDNAAVQRAEQRQR